jgi:hypothetical protein
MDISFSVGAISLSSLSLDSGRGESRIEKTRFHKKSYSLTENVRPCLGIAQCSYLIC